MSEKAPTGQETLQKRREQIAKQRKEIAKQQGIVDKQEYTLAREEAFGKYDDVDPAEGEVSYSTYAAMRPDEIEQKNGALRYAESKEPATAEAYAQQNESQQDYYDRVGGLVNEGGEWEKPDYEGMGVMQLAKEASKARQLGDIATEKEVVEAAHEYLTAEAMNDDKESAEAAQARFEQELERFESLIAKMSAPKVGEVAPEAAAEGAAPDAGTSTSEKKAPEAADAAVPEVDEKPKPLFVEVELGGEKYALGDVFVSPSGEKIVKLYRSDGSALYASESEITKVENTGTEAAESAPAAAPEAAAESRQPSKEVVPFSGEAGGTEEDIVDAEIVEDGEDTSGAIPIKPAFIVDSKGEATVDEEVLAAGGPVSVTMEGLKAQAMAEREKSITDRLKAWAKKARATIQRMGGSGYWAEKWHHAKQGFNDKVLNHGITETMDEAQKEKLRKRNRTAVLIGGGALAVAAIGGALWMGGSFDGGMDTASAAPTPEISGAEVPGADGGISPDLEEVLNGGGDGVPQGTEIDPSTYNLEPLTVDRGMGGEQLFVDAGLDKADWYTHENDLLRKFPDEFYRMDDGHVGIANVGDLPTDVQQYIESLK